MKAKAPSSAATLSCPVATPRSCARAKSDAIRYLGSLANPVAVFARPSGLVKELVEFGSWRIGR